MHTTTQAATWTLNEDALDTFILTVIEHYETTAPTVATWAERLSIRIATEPEKVSLYELRQFSFLYSDGQWQQPNYAANRAYKVLDATGQDTTGMLSF